MLRMRMHAWRQTRGLLAMSVRHSVTQSMTPASAHCVAMAGCLSVIAASTPSTSSATSSSRGWDAAHCSRVVGASCAASSSFVPSLLDSCRSAPSPDLTTSRCCLLCRRAMSAKMVSTPPSSEKDLQMSSLAASCRMHASMADTVGAEDSGELGLVVGLGAGGAAPAPALLWASELELFQPAIMPFRSDSRVLRAWFSCASRRACWNALLVGGRSSSAVHTARSTPLALATRSSVSWRGSCCSSSASPKP
mmetsp:Transcript_28611/g.77191  ORF Transcript_28611/g.77191 Transcript_28611/m.77191 type:complete len:250 (-) Transcript_28611:16-765(-)